jgi:hypothetical protein
MSGEVRRGINGVIARMTWKQITPVEMAEVVGELLKEYIDPLRARIGALEAAEAQKCWRGVFSETETYHKHNSVTHHGCLWIAVEDAPGVPGEHSTGWRLAVKKGRDAR